MADESKTLEQLEGMLIRTPMPRVGEYIAAHKKVSPAADVGGPNTVMASDWNDRHIFNGGVDGQVLMRDSGALDGASWTNAGAGGVTMLFSDVAQTGTVADTTETDLSTYTIPADTLVADGAMLEADFWLQCGANTTSKTMRVYLGGTLLMATSGIGWDQNLFHFRIWVQRVSAGNQLVHTWGMTDGAVTGTLSNDMTGSAYQRNLQALTLDETTALIIKATGQNTMPNVNDVRCRGARVLYYPAPEEGGEELAPMAPEGPITVATFDYTFSDEQSPVARGLTNGQVSLNADTYADATVIWISRYDNDGEDQRTIHMLRQAGDIFRLEIYNNADRYAQYRLIHLPVDQGDRVELPVEYMHSAGDPFLPGDALSLFWGGAVVSFDAMWLGTSPPLNPVVELWADTTTDPPVLKAKTGETWTAVSSVGGVGPAGPAGEIGPIGPIGPAGPQGEIGPTGLQGPQGVQGIQGEIGPAGPTGPTGADGIQGPAGATGIQGPAGATGIQGPAGATGPQGEIGPEGPQGIQGVQGDQGLIGPPGPQGDPGPQGVQGAVGPQGVDGVVGPVGATGPEGPQGIQGIQGVPGETGPIGPEGPEGPQGPQGEVGPTGVTGSQGVQGPAGPGVPPGGAVGNMLAKAVGGDYVTQWQAIPPIADNSITNLKLRDSTGPCVIGRSASGLGDPADILASTNEQVLRRTSNALSFGAVNLASTAAVTGILPAANMDPTFVGAGIPKSLVNAKGDLLVATAADTVDRVAVGADGTVLTADSAEPSGTKWTVPAATVDVLWTGAEAPTDATIELWATPGDPGMVQPFDFDTYLMWKNAAGTPTFGIGLGPPTTDIPGLTGVTDTLWIGDEAASTVLIGPVGIHGSLFAHGGDIALSNNRYFQGYRSDGATLDNLIGVGTDNNIHIATAITTRAVYIGGVGGNVFAQGDLQLSNNKRLLGRRADNSWQPLIQQGGDDMLYVGAELPAGRKIRLWSTGGVETAGPLAVTAGALTLPMDVNHMVGTAQLAHQSSTNGWLYLSRNVNCYMNDLGGATEFVGATTFRSNVAIHNDRTFAASNGQWIAYARSSPPEILFAYNANARFNESSGATLFNRDVYLNTGSWVRGFSGGLLMMYTPADLHVAYDTNLIVNAAGGLASFARDVHVAGILYKTSVGAYTFPDFVFEHHFTGGIERFRDAPGAETYEGLWPLERVEEFAREHWRLPGHAARAEDRVDIFRRTHDLLAECERIYLHLIEHEKRLAALEDR